MRVRHECPGGTTWALAFDIINILSYNERSWLTLSFVGGGAVHSFTAPPLCYNEDMMKRSTLPSMIFVAALAVLVNALDGQIAVWFTTRGVGKNPLEYPIVAVALGLVANAIFRLMDFKINAYSEMYLKAGLILLGVKVSLGDALAIGAGGLVQALIMVTSVFFFTWWLAGKAHLDDKLRAVMAAAVSICGVSAAIAAAGAVMAKREQVSYIACLVIVTAIPLMVLMPPLAHAMGLSPQVAGAWFGGNIDTTAAVVGAGTIHGPEAQAVATVVKMSQNVLIGVAAFALALYFTAVVERKPGERPSAKVIWQRFPKFVIGFLLLSALATVRALPGDVVKVASDAGRWLFIAAFVGMGLEFDVSAIRSMGARPVLVYLAATVFNTLLALVVAGVIFG